MPAWTKTVQWTEETYRKYREYVRLKAPSLKGRTEDCSKLSILLLVDFAHQAGLPITLQGGYGRFYCSMEDQQYPPEQIIGETLTWKNRQEFYEALKRRINAESLFRYNTVDNPSGPQAGDLMLSTGHAALVINTYQAYVPHPKASNDRIPNFPGPDVAKTQLDQLEYFKSREPDNTVRFDYLNHRGQGKEKAELLYFSKPEVMKGYGFQFRKFNKGVMRDQPISAIFKEIREKALELDRKMPGSAYKPGPKW